MNTIIDNFQGKRPRAQEPQQTILVIDDSTDTLLLNKTVLEMEGFKVLTAQNATEAFALLAEISDFDLILLDMKMDEMSGLEFLDKLEKDRPEIIESVPVVFLTGVDEIPKCKAVGFLRKPVAA